MRHSNSKMNCLFKGVGGGRIEAQGNAFLTIAVGQAKVEGRFVILKTHEPTLPRFLLGMDIITGDLEGVRIKRNTVRFEIDPLVVFESSLQAEAIEEEEEEVVSLIDTKMGGSSQDWSCHFQDLAKLEAFRRSTPDPNQDRQGFVKRVARLEAREEEQAFEDVPLPAIDTKLRLDGLPATTLDAQVIIDSGSSFNLISRALALQLQKQQKDKWDERRARVPLPDIRTANGGIMKATQCLWLQVEYQEKHVTEALPFFVFEELPLAAIIGHETSEQWKAVLSWKDKTFSFTPRDSSEVTITWTPRQGKHWRGAVNLLAKQDYVVPAGSQKKIFLDLERGSLSNQGIRGEGGLITQQKYPRQYDVPLAVEDKQPTWMQVRNLNGKPVHIKKGVVALFHPRQDYDIAEAPGLDPTREDILKEKQQLHKQRQEASSRKKAMDKIWEKDLAEGYVRLVQPQDGQPKEVDQQANNKKCDCCRLDTCPEYTGDELAKREQDEKAVVEMGVDLSIPRRWRTKCEVDKLIQWALKWTSVINKHGLLSPERVMKHATKCVIETTEQPKFKARPDKSTPAQKLEIEKMIEEKLQQGIIEQSSAPWSSNCVCIRKDGKTRIAVDYRKLNQITVRDNYLLPKISEVLDTLGGCQWFTSADAAQAYHQIPMGSDRDKDLTTFVSPSGGLYRYRAMPFGLANAGAVWSRFIDGAMGGLRWNICCVYADDILCFSRGRGVDEHIKHLDQIFERLDKFGITVKGSKLQLGAKELPFLGQIISTEGFKPNPTKIKAIVELEAPTNVAQLRKIMGMFAHYAKYIPGFSQIAAPLYELTRKDAENKRDANRRIDFGERQLASFQKLKTCLTTEPIMLAFPRGGCPYEFIATRAR